MSNTTTTNKNSVNVTLTTSRICRMPLCTNTVHHIDWHIVLCAQCIAKAHEAIFSPRYHKPNTTIQTKPDMEPLTL
jgi:hypothetical protein